MIYDDLDYDSNPSAVKYIDGIDQDCDGLNDDVPLHVFILRTIEHDSIDPSVKFIPLLEQRFDPSTIEVVHQIGSRSIGHWDHEYCI